MNGERSRIIDGKIKELTLLFLSTVTENTRTSNFGL